MVLSSSRHAHERAHQLLRGLPDPRIEVGRPPSAGQSALAKAVVARVGWLEVELEICLPSGHCFDFVQYSNHRTRFAASQKEFTQPNARLRRLLQDELSHVRRNNRVSDRMRAAEAVGDPGPGHLLREG